MVHEFSHVSIGTKDVAYGCLVGIKSQSAPFSKGSAALVPSAIAGFALLNADSYRCWAEDSYLGWTGNGPLGPAPSWSAP